jgi:hypothetical protein
MTKKYYKTSAPAVLTALAERNEKLTALRLRGEAFQKHFGAKNLVVSSSTEGYRIRGLQFDPPKDRRLWTVPDHEHLDMQRPRQSITKATPDEKAELARLKAEWKEHFPTGDVPFEPVLTAMGTTWVALIFGAGFHMHERDGAVYVATAAKLNDLMVEILASEYEAATAKETA